MELMLCFGVKLGMTRGCVRGSALGFTSVALTPRWVAGDGESTVMPKRLPLESILALGS